MIIDFKDEVELEKFVEIIENNKRTNGLINNISACQELIEKFERGTAEEWAWAIRKYREKKTPNIQKRVTKNARDLSESKKGLTDKKKKDILDFIKTPKNMDYLINRFNITEYELLGYLTSLNIDGVYRISIEKGKDGTWVSYVRAIEPIKREYCHSIGEERKFAFMAISDSHICGIFEQLSFVNFLYDLAKERGIENIYHIGDISDGFYQNRPEHLYSLHKRGFDEQADYIIRNYPKRDGITTHFILGNHDETHIKNGGANIGIRISQSRPDMDYLGCGSAKVWFTDKCCMDLIHPLDGSAYALSYAGQKYIDALPGGNKPNILLVGHHHKSMYFAYRNIHYFEVPSTCMQSDWEKRKRLNNQSGAWIITITVDESGTITSLQNEAIEQYNKIPNDYLNYK